MLKKLWHNRFMRISLYVLAGVAVLAGGFMLGWRLLVRPPSIPVHAEQPFIHNPHIINAPEGDHPAFDITEPHPDDAMPGLDMPSTTWVRREDFFTALIFGYDAGRNTDTVMVAAFDVGNNRAYLINIPRDTRIDVVRRSGRINSAYAAGRAGGGGHDGGVDQLRREVQTIIGFMPDFYISAAEHAFVRIVDAVGGVNITVPFHMYYTDASQNLFINIPAGAQRLNGENALNFVRYRLGNDPARTISDQRRTEHAQILIRAILDELRSPAVILRVPELVSTYIDHVNTDLSRIDMLYFAEQFLTQDVALHTYTYPTRALLDIRWYQIPVQDEVIALINRTINPFTRDLTIDNFQFFQ